MNRRLPRSRCSINSKSPTVGFSAANVVANAWQWRGQRRSLVAGLTRPITSHGSKFLRSARRSRRLRRSAGQAAKSLCARCWWSWSDVAGSHAVGALKGPVECREIIKPPRECDIRNRAVRGRRVGEKRFDLLEPAAFYPLADAHALEFKQKMQRPHRHS